MYVNNTQTANTYLENNLHSYSGFYGNTFYIPNHIVYKTQSIVQFIFTNIAMIQSIS